MVLEEWAVPDLEWVIAQLVTELATNAVLHAGTSFDIRLSLDADRLRCEVLDRGPRVPRMRRFGAEATTGRGLQMVEQLATDWGVARVSTGKVVWFDLAREAGLKGDGSDRDSASPDDARDGLLHGADLDALIAAFPDSAPASGSVGGREAEALLAA